MNTSVKQYIDLYDSAVELIGERRQQRAALAQAVEGELDPAFAPTDYGMNLQRLPLQVDIARSFGCDVPSVTALPVAVVNDIFAAPDRFETRLPQGVTVMSLRQAARECPQLIPTDIAGIDDAETRLNDLLWTDGVLIRVSDGVRLEKPLQLVNIFSSPINLMAMRRLAVVLGRDSEARLLVCDHTQDSERRYLSAELIQVSLASGARLGLDFIEEASAETTRRSTLNAHLDSKSTLECTSATLSCGDSRMRTHVILGGEGAHASLNGMVIADKDQHAAHHTRVIHKAEYTTSNQLFKFVADNNSGCTFNGRIVVEEQARFTEAYQTNRNLLASANARMHTEPTLEIYCDEVKCSHGAATGQLDERAMFYMRQRGIEQETARRMLMEAFVADVIESVHVPGLRDRLRHLVERRFSGLGSDVATCADCNLTGNKCNGI